MLNLISTITGCVWISPHASLVFVPVAITSSTVGIKICAITAGIKKYKSIIKKKKKKHDEIVLLGKGKLNTIEVLISKALMNSEFMPELHLKQPGFTYSACGPFTKHCERVQKFRETGNLKRLYRNELDKACFAHDAAYSDSKLFQIRLWKIELMKLLEIVDMIKALAKSISKNGLEVFS